MKEHLLFIREGSLNFSLELSSRILQIRLLFPQCSLLEGGVSDFLLLGSFFRRRVLIFLGGSSCKLSLPIFSFVCCFFLGILNFGAVSLRFDFGFIETRPSFTYVAYMVLADEYFMPIRFAAWNCYEYSFARGLPWKLISLSVGPNQPTFVSFFGL